jgi:hypothetical protein
MKNLYNKIKGFFAVTSGRVHAAISGTQAVIKSNKAEGFVDSAVKILIAVVIGALLLGGLYLLFGNTILPTLTQRITDMFNYKG